MATSLSKFIFDTDLLNYSHGIVKRNHPPDYERIINAIGIFDKPKTDIFSDFFLQNRKFFHFKANYPAFVDDNKHRRAVSFWLFRLKKK